MPRDTALAANEDLTVTLRVDVARVLAPEELADFSLQSHQVPPYNAVVNLGELGKRLEAPERCNLILVGAPGSNGSNGDAREGALPRADLERAFGATWTLDDLEPRPARRPPPWASSS